MYVTNIVVDSVLSVSSFQDLIATLYSFPRRDIQTRFLVSVFPNGRGEKKALYSRKTLKNLRFGSNGIRARVSNVIIGQ